MITVRKCRTKFKLLKYQQNAISIASKLRTSSIQFKLFKRCLPICYKKILYRLYSPPCASWYRHFISFDKFKKNTLQTMHFFCFLANDLSKTCTNLSSFFLNVLQQTSLLFSLNDIHRKHSMLIPILSRLSG